MQGNHKLSCTGSHQEKSPAPPLASEGLFHAQEKHGFGAQEEHCQHSFLLHNNLIWYISITVREKILPLH